jgi:hypothetical protein
MDTLAYHTAIGRIKYDPPRPGMRKKTRASGRSNKDWWCILKVDKEITRYYRWWIQHHMWGWTVVQPDWLCQPSWDAHVSIVRGEQPRTNRDTWCKYDGEKVEFRYAHYPRRTTMEDRKNRYTKDGDFWFVDVECPRIDEIRTELGLRSNFRYHLTVGRTYDNR